jgi:hypothetical protein
VRLLLQVERDRGCHGLALRHSAAHTGPAAWRPALPAQHRHEQPVEVQRGCGVQRRSTRAVRGVAAARAGVW